MDIWRTDDQWWTDDKWAHGFGAWAATMTFALWLPLVGAVLLTVGVSVGVEVIEYWRYRHWVSEGAPNPWPFLADLISPKDLVWDAAGIAWAALLVCLGRLT